MSNSLPEFQIKVRPSRETNDHEVCLLANGVDLVELFAPGLMGLDPDGLLVEPCALLATRQPHLAVIGRCGCGVVGCASTEVQIEMSDEVVRWTATDSDRSVQFAATQYSHEVDRSLRDYSWETPERTASRLIARAVDRQSLASQGFEFSWASGRCTEGMMTVSLLLRPDLCQVFVRLPWDGKDIESIVAQFAASLRQPPVSWPV